MSATENEQTAADYETAARESFVLAIEALDVGEVVLAKRGLTTGLRWLDEASAWKAPTS